jgi:predicted N-acetyltransferase YhbS
MYDYTVREARPEEQRELTRLCVRATLQAGYDDAFIDCAMPALTVTLPAIKADCVRVAQDSAGNIVGIVSVMPSPLQGIAMLHHMFVDPACWKRGIGRMLFQAAVVRARALKTGAITITAEPSAEGFYQRMGAVRIGEQAFFFSPDIVLPHLLYLVPPQT